MQTSLLSPIGITLLVTVPILVVGAWLYMRRTKPLVPAGISGRRRPTWTWICSLSSIALFLALVAMAVHIRIALGRWPIFGEELNMLPFTVHELIVAALALFAAFVAAPLWLVLLVYRPFRISVGVHLLQAVLFGSGWLLILCAGEYDPTPFTNWFLD